MGAREAEILPWYGNHIPAKIDARIRRTRHGVSECRFAFSVGSKLTVKSFAYVKAEYEHSSGRSRFATLFDSFDFLINLISSA